MLYMCLYSQCQEGGQIGKRQDAANQHDDEKKEPPAYTMSEDIYLIAIGLIQ